MKVHPSYVWSTDQRLTLLSQGTESHSNSIREWLVAGKMIVTIEMAMN